MSRKMIPSNSKSSPVMAPINIAEARTLGAMHKNEQDRVPTAK